MRRDVAEVGGAPDQHDAGKAAAASGATLTSRVRLCAAHDAQMQEPLAGEVVEKASAAPQQALVLLRRGELPIIAPESTTPGDDPLR